MQLYEPKLIQVADRANSLASSLPRVWHFQAALAAQLSDWLALQAKYPGEDLFVLGDFNQDLAPAHYYGSRQNRQALQEALDQVGLVALTAGTKDPVWRGSAPCASIDHICVPKTYDRQRERDSLERWPEGPVPDKTLSDHFGVSAELSHRDEASTGAQ